MSRLFTYASRLFGVGLGPMTFRVNPQLVFGVVNLGLYQNLFRFGSRFIMSVDLPSRSCFAAGLLVQFFF